MSAQPQRRSTNNDMGGTLRSVPREILKQYFMQLVQQLNITARTVPGHNSVKVLDKEKSYLSLQCAIRARARLYMDMKLKTKNT